MRAAFMPAAGRLEVGDFPEPVPGEGEVVVEMHHASICGSDVHVVFDGFHTPERLGAPGYPGHEGVGVVVESRSPRFTPGTPVLTVPFGYLGGCFAEYQHIDDGHVIALPDGAGLRGLLPAQQLGTTIFAMKKFTGGRTIEPGTAVIIGAGSAGLYFLQLVLRMGFSQVIVSDLNEGRLAIAKSLGATHTVHHPAASVTEAALDLSGGVGADLVIEAAGYDSCRADAVRMVRYAGVIGCFGFPESRDDAPYPAYEAFRKAATIEWVVGTQSEPGLASFRAAVDEIARGTIEVAHCLDCAYPLEEATAAMDLAHMQGGGHAKVNLTMSAARSEPA
ncbi:MAG: zinc-binding dehydrogenase [Streptosporangiales bacterium]|nr:zinc-binding dehydrogenase [Streptosporangiales bacterium]